MKRLCWVMMAVVMAAPAVTSGFSSTLGTAEQRVAATVVTGPTVTPSTKRRQVLVPGQPLSLEVSASGAGELHYQWYHDGRVIAGAGSAVFSVDQTSVSDTGAYWAIVTDDNGASRSAPMFVLLAPTQTQTVGWGLNDSGQSTTPELLTDAVQIAVGVYHSLALRADGTVVAWGSNTLGQATVPAGLSDVVMIAGGRSHSLALKSDGTVLAWGSAWDSEAQVPAGLESVAAIAAGDTFSLALKTDGTVVGWGTPSLGQPLVPDNLVGVVAIAARGFDALALKRDGTVVAWGYNGSGQADVPAGLGDVGAISEGGMHALVLKTDGSLATWGGEAAYVPFGLKSAEAVVAGCSHSLALKADGTVVAWGNDDHGQLDVPAELAGVVAIAGSYHNLALRDATEDTVPVIAVQPTAQTALQESRVTLRVEASGGTAPLTYQWRRNGEPIAGANGPELTIEELKSADAGNYDVMVSDWLGATVSDAAVLTVQAFPLVTNESASRQVLTPGQSLALTVSATGVGPLTYQWYHDGRALAGQTGESLAVDTVSLTDAGAYWVAVTDRIGTARSAAMFVLVRSTSTRVVGWGSDAHGETEVPAELGDVVAIAAGGSCSLALRSDGTVARWGYVGASERAMPQGLTDVVAIAAGSGHFLALRSDGTVAAWGDDWAGQLEVPAGLGDVVAIAAGGPCSLALRSNGTVVAWGQYIAPVPEGLVDVVAIATEGAFSVALKRDGTVVAWGSNTAAATIVPAGLSEVVAIAIGDRHALALKGDGTVVAWGDNFYGATEVPPGLTDVTAIAAGWSCSLALQRNGAIVAWGVNDSGQTTVPAGLDGVVALCAGDSHALALCDPASEPRAVIVSQPADQTVIEESAATFQVIASGGIGALTYQWRKDGKPIAEATEATFTIAKANPADAARYDVVVSDRSGAVVSEVATLGVRPLPVVSVQSAFRQVLIPGQSATLAVAATGTGDLSFQWYHNGWAIVGATEESCQISAAVAGDAGAYWVEVTDDVGMRRSAPMFVLVAPESTRVVEWHAPYRSDETAVPAGLSDAVAVSVGGSHSLALKRDGTVVAWGGNNYGQATVTSGLTGVVAIAAGGNFSLVLKSDGTITSWGAAQNLVPAGLTGVVAIAAGDSYALALKSDGTLVAWGSLGYQSVKVPDAMSGVTAVAAGGDSYLTLHADGVLKAWGVGGVGLPDLPEPVSGGVEAMAAGPRHFLALKNDGTVVAWGPGSYGETTVPANLSGVVAVAASTGSSLALKSDGTVVAWGSDLYGPTDVPADLRRVIAISSGGFQALALCDATDAPPTISTIADQTTIEDTATAALSFMVGDDLTAESELTVSATSSDATLIPAENIVLGGSGAQRTIRLTPAANANGSATITLMVSDGALTSSTSFKVAVTAVNDAPTITSIPDQTHVEGYWPTPFEFAVADVETSADDLVVTAKSSNLDLVPLVAIQLKGSGAAARAVVVYPTAGKFGTATVTLSVSDGELVTETSFRVTVIENKPPTISAIPDQRTDKDQPLRDIPFEVDDPDTAPENLTVGILPWGSPVVPDQNVVVSGSGRHRTVSVTPAGGKTGFTPVTLMVFDGVTHVSSSFVVYVNGAPEISAVADQVTREDMATSRIGFSVGDPDGIYGQIYSVSASSSNPTLVPKANIEIGGIGTHYTVRVTPAANRSGRATITLTVSDGSLSASTSFTVTVTAVNDAPTITPPADVGIAKERSRTVAFKVADAETTASQLKVSAVCSNAGLVPKANLILGGSGGNRTLKITPARNRTGESTIWLTVVDENGAKGTAKFKVTVAHPPSIAAIASQTTNEDTMTGPIAVVLSDPDTPSSKLKLGAKSSSPGLIPANAYAFGGSSGNRTLRIKPAANKSGTATITLTASDGQLTAYRSFKLVVKPVNDRPTISAVANQTVNKNAATKAIPFKIADAETPASKLKLTKASSNATLLPTANIILGGSGANRTVTLRPAKNRTGTAKVTITVSDGQLTANRTFMLTVNAPPTIARVANQTIKSGSSTNLLRFAIADAETAATKLKVTATSSNAALVASSGIKLGGSGANRTIRVTPVKGKSGAVKITLMVSDGHAAAATSFWVTVTASATGRKVAAGAMLEKPAIRTPPRPQIVKAGAAVTLSMEATGATSYRWLHDGAEVTGATAATLDLGAVRLTDAGGYAVTATNAAGSTTSATAELTVVEAKTVATRSGPIVAVTQTLAIAGAADGMRLSVPLSSGWRYLSGATGGATTHPASGDMSLLEWTWKTSPVEPVAFTYVLDAPANQAVPDSLDALLEVRSDGARTKLLLNEATDAKQASSSR